MSGFRQLDNYVHGAIREPYRICGLKMKPFSLGHLFLMYRFNCPFASDNPNQKASCSDLLLACLICSRTFEGALSFLENEEFQLEHGWELPYYWWQSTLDFIGRKFQTGTWFDGLLPLPTYSARWMKKWTRIITKAFKKNKLDAYEQFKLFNDYRRTDLYIPYFKINQKENADISGAHWSMNVFEFLTKELGYSDTKALNLPLARALIEYYKGLETTGCLSLLNDFECDVTDGLIKQ